MLPQGERLGGAPANFAVMAARLGNRGVIASRLGADALGERAHIVLSRFPVDLACLQLDPKQPTGTVGVEISNGEPRYVIHAPAAWDFLEWTSELRRLATSADAVCFGTLAQREATARKTIGRFLQATRPDCVRIFDVNLRAPFYTAEIISQSLPLATIFKLNESEVPIVLHMLGGPSEFTLVSAARWLIERTPLKLVAITRGAYGSVLVTGSDVNLHPGIPSKVVDTVGAGDAFTAGLVDAWLHGTTIAEMNEAGNRWGSWVASQPGAMPELNPAQ